MPAYASHVLVELYARAEGRLSVHLSYNHRPLPLPGCDAAEGCSLEHFERYCFFFLFL